MDKNSTGTVLGVVAVAIALGAFFFSVLSGPTSAPTNKTVGGERAGLQEFFDGVKSGDIASRWYSAKIGPLANNVKVYCNTSGHDTVATYGAITIPTGDTASSTLNMSLFATSSSNTSVPSTQDFTAIAEGKRAIMQNVQIATSTTASTTDSMLAAAMKVGNGSVLVPSDSCVFAYLQQDIAKCSIAGAAASPAVCGTATSSDRGFNPIANVLIRSISADRPSF